MIVACDDARMLPAADVTASDPLRSLLRASHLLTADQLAASTQEHARLLGATETVVYLTDYEQVTLLPLPGAGVPERSDLPIEGSLAGLAFTRITEIDSTPQPGAHRRWFPMLDGVERLGVVEVVLPVELTPELDRELQLLISLVAELIVNKNAYSDAFARIRRRKSLSLAAEIQWHLLPPLTFGTDRIVITGALEPAYDIGGDTFDYAVNHDVADLVMLDSVGHGLPAAMLSTLALGAYRHARRERLDLPDIARAMDAAIAGQIGGSQFATAVIARLEIDTGRLHWVNAGHLPPLILRGTSLVQPPAYPPDRPLGLQDRPATMHETRLEPGDRVLFSTDGITEARSPTGEFFGEQRLADFVSAAAAADVPAPETMRRLVRQVLAHQEGHLQDDASIVLLEWRSGEERALDPMQQAS